MHNHEFPQKGRASEPTKYQDRNYSRTFRLLDSKDYKRVFKRVDCKSSDQYLTILACKNGSDHPRLGLAITKKKLRTAVSRHRIKRLVRESFRHHKHCLKGLDVVVMGQSVCEKVSNQVLFDKLHSHWLRLAKRCEKF